MQALKIILIILNFLNKNTTRSLNNRTTKIVSSSREDMMISWKLFLHMVLAHNAYQNPVYWHEATHPPIWQDLARRLSLVKEGQAAWIAALGVLWIVATFFVNNLLFFLVPPLILLITLTVLAIAPLVVEERTRQRWELLLITPGGAEEVLVGKASGGLYWIQQMLVVMAVLLLFVAACVGLYSIILIPNAVIHTAEESHVYLCGFVLVLLMAGAVLFVIDRIQHYTLIVLTVLAASTSSPSVRQAVLMANAGIAVLWLAESAITEFFLVLHAGWAWRAGPSYLLARLTLGPAVGYIMQADLLEAGLFIIVTLALREAAIWGLWRWVLRVART